MLTIEIDFLLGSFYGAVDKGRKIPEWPPSLWRVYLALVSACPKTTTDTLSEDYRQAILWLESQGPPELYMPEKVDTQSPSTFSPYDRSGDGNLSGKYAGKGPYLGSYDTRAKGLIHQPHINLKTNSVFYVWPDAKPSEKILSCLVRITKYISYIGTSESKAIVKISDSPPDFEGQHLHHLRPDPHGKEAMVCPQKGLLEHLEACYANGSNPMRLDTERYSLVEPDSEEVTSPPSSFEKCYYFKLTGPFRPKITDTAVVSDQIHRALCSHCANLEIEVPIISSNSKIPHLAQIPLPYVGSFHATGQIFGFALCIPKETSQQEIVKVETVMAKLDTLMIQGNQWQVEKVDAERGCPVTLRSSKWEQVSSHWTSVTPVFMRWTKTVDRAKENFQWISKHCQDLGLPPVVECRTALHALITGANPAKHYGSRNKLKKRQPGFQIHVELEFESPVKGPLVLGRERNFGNGLFVPARSRG